MAMKKNVKASKRASGAASPEVGAPTWSYSKSQSRRNIKPVTADDPKSRG